VVCNPSRQVDLPITVTPGHTFLLRMRPFRHALALLTLSACLAAGQQSPVPTRQSVDDAWWTGPLLAPNASTLPRGHVLIEPYLYDVIPQGFYDSSGTRQSIPHANEFGSLTYINYGLANKFTVGLIPVFGYNEVNQGLNSSSVEVGDLTVQAQYRLHLFHEGSWSRTFPHHFRICNLLILQNEENAKRPTQAHPSYNYRTICFLKKRA
jgi:hypothetical protein